MAQQKLADAVSVSRQTIVSIEKGKYSPALEVAFKIANIFKQPINLLFFLSRRKSTPRLITTRELDLFH